MMKKLSIVLMLLGLVPALAYTDESVYLRYDSRDVLVNDGSRIDISDRDSVKRGAKSFVDYCMSCHEASFMRFNRIASDTGMDESELRENLIFTRDAKGKPTKTGELMKSSMSDSYARKAFGIEAPDLSLTARSRGGDWLFTYLRTFYADDYRSTGVNNVRFEGVAMPHVLAQLQGIYKPVYKTVQRSSGDNIVEKEIIAKLEMVTPGSMTKQEYNNFVRDLVNFMVYLAEPIQVERRSLGWKVLAFLLVFFIFAFLLKKEYWKDVH